jgi:hypothetical protein
MLYKSTASEIFYGYLVSTATAGKEVITNTGKLITA